MCEQLCISKSYYYGNNTKIKIRDEKEFYLISKIFLKGKEKDGIRQLKMRLHREEGVIMSHKKIARLKKKFGLKTKIRIKNKYRKFVRAVHEHNTCPNLLDRNFKGLGADQVYVTDITTLKYEGKRAYFAAVKDLGTKEIVGASVSNRIDMELTNSAMKQALVKLSSSKKSKLLVHSDQGFNFTHYSFRNLLEFEGVTQSMSRKGNCIDNAPMESFFGLIKDHLILKGCKRIEDIRKEVTKTLNYYNNERPQVGLKKMPPSEYRRHFI